MNLEKHFGEQSVKCLKYLPLCITANFVLISVLIFAFVTTLSGSYRDWDFYLENQVLSLSACLIAIKIFVRFVALYWCIVIIKECVIHITMVAAILVIELAMATLIGCSAAAVYSLWSPVSMMVDASHHVTSWKNTLWKKKI